MSQLNDDRLVLQEGRRDALKDAEVSLRDQIPKKLAEKLEELEVGKKVADMWSHGNADRQEWLERQEEFLGQWDEFLAVDTDGPFEGSSNLHIPMPLIVCKTLHARFLQALIGIDPYFTTKARTEAFIERTQLVQDLMAYTLKDWINQYDGVDEVLDLWVWDWVTTGVGLLKGRWEKQFERFIDVEQVPKPRIRYAYNEETQREEEVTEYQLVDEERKVTRVKFQGPMLDYRHPEDVLIIGGQGDPQKADAVIDSYSLTASDLWTYVDSKVFNEDAVREIIDKGPDHEDSSDSTQIKRSRNTNAGVDAVDSDSDLDRYKILEAYLRLDVDGSGINSDVVVWVHPRSRKILRATYLHRINKAGERPFFKIDFFKRPGQTYGIGLVEMLYPLSKEMDAIHNMRIDFGLLATMPIGFYRPTSSIEPETLQLRPGDLIPLDNPTEDVYFPNLGNRTSFGFQEEAAIQTMIERLTGINDLSLGVLTGAQGATRTATGARALLGESNANLDVYLRRLQRGWRRCLKYILHSLQQRIPPGFEFRVTGEGGQDYFAQVRNQQDICGDYDFEISPNSANSNRAIQEEVSTSILQLVQNPLLIQTGVVSQANLYEAVKQWMRAKGIKDFGKYITKPEGYQYVPSPGEEANRILRGIPVPVVANMDHQGFIAYFEEIFGSDELLGQFDEEQAKALAVQANKHKEMLAALDSAAAQQANSSQMRMNAAQSAEQAPVGTNPMAVNGGEQ